MRASLIQNQLLKNHFWLEAAEVHVVSRREQQTKAKNRQLEPNIPTVTSSLLRDAHRTLALNRSLAKMLKTVGTTAHPEQPSVGKIIQVLRNLPKEEKDPSLTRQSQILSETPSWNLRSLKRSAIGINKLRLRLRPKPSSKTKGKRKNFSMTQMEVIMNPTSRMTINKMMLLAQMQVATQQAPLMMIKLIQKVKATISCSSRTLNLMWLKSISTRISLKLKFNLLQQTPQELPKAM